MKRTTANWSSRAVHLRLAFLLLMIALLPFGLSSLAAEDDGDGGDAAEEEQKAKSVEPRLSARLRVEYDYRSQGDYEDNDLNGRLYASGYDLFEKRLDVYIALRLYHDLDEPESLSLGDDRFISLKDRGGATEDRLLQAYVDIHNTSKELSLRAGRQYVDVADYLQLDGAQIVYNEKGRLGGRVYYGRPVSFYTSVSSDYAGGVSLVGKPFENNVSRITYATYHDDSEGGSDDHYFLDMRQRFTDHMRARARLSYLNEEFRMGRFDLNYNSLDDVFDLSAGVSYWGEFDANTRAYSPLYSVLGEQEPYTYTYVRLTRKIADHWYVAPGGAIRSVDEDDESYGSRDYEKVTLALIYEPSRSFSSTIALDHWSVKDDDSFSGVSGDVRYRRKRDWEIRAGASYAQYKYNTYSDLNYFVSGGQVVFSEGGTVEEESPYVYTYYLKAKWKLTQALTLRLQGDVEDNTSEEHKSYRARASVEVKL